MAPHSSAAAAPSSSSSTSSARLSAVGWMLREWRTSRGLSQLALGAEAGVSTRHLSFVETGRAEPSRELLMKLSAVLGMPPRDRNALLSAAGYQPIYRETAADSPQMKDLLHAVSLILRQHDPVGAVAVDRDFSMVMCNRGFATFLQLLGAPGVPEPFVYIPNPTLNLVDALFDPALGLRSAITNWKEVAANVLWRTRSELAATRDAHGRQQQERLLRHPGVAELLAEGPPQHDAGFVLPLQLTVAGMQLQLFTTITTLGTPQDLTACEMRIEAYHPADKATDALLRSLVPDGTPPPPRA